MKANIPDPKHKRVVIIGAGFGGLALARSLAKKGQYQVVLVDKHNYHQFQPLLYQVATGGLEADSIAYPLRKIFPSHKNVHIRLCEVLNIVSAEKYINTTIGIIRYDHLVIATGAETNFFGNAELEANSMKMKSVTQALDLRSRILQNFEEALLIDNPEEQKRLMTIVVVGGGPTGVEVCGALSEMKKYVLPKDFPELDFRHMSIYLIESSDRVLSAMSPEASEKAATFLKKMGVHVVNGARVQSFDGKTVTIQGHEDIQTDILIWSAGVKGDTPHGLEATSIGRANRILVNEYNIVKGYEEIYAIGDVACMQTEATPNGHPQLAPVAQQQADVLSDNLHALLVGKPMKPFVYNDKGVMATIGRNAAVVDLKFWKIGGFLAWLIWMFIHLMAIVGFRNRVAVLITWFWNYLRYDQALRLIIRPYKKYNRDIGVSSRAAVKDN